MAQIRRNTYWLLLLVLVLAAAVLSVGETQARYEADTLVFNTVLTPGGDTVTSDCLVSVSGTPLTVLLGQSDTAGFVLESACDTTGALTWYADQEDYLDVRLSIGFSFLNQGEPVSLTGGVPVSVAMTLTPTVKALTTVHEEMEIDVNVFWNQSLTGTFRVTLPQVTEADLEVPAEESVTEAPADPETEEPSGGQTGEPATIAGQVTLSGRDLRAGEFTFYLYDTGDDYAVAEDAVPAAAAVNDGTGVFGFDAVTFDTAGTYHYVVTQAPAAEGSGIDWDESRYLVCVTVGDTEGSLTVRTDVTDEQGGETTLLFANTYTPAPAVFTISGSKGITGAAMEAEMFRFLLFRSDETFQNRTEFLQWTVNDADGGFAFEALEFSAAGTYYYIVDEDLSNPLANMTYDDRSYAVTITVTDDGSGKLAAAWSVSVIGGETVDEIVFNSAYVPSEEEEPAVVLEALPSFSPAADLPVLISARTQVETVCLGLAGEDGAVQPFPAKTRYSLDQGRSYYMLYNAGTITVNVHDGEPAAVLLDLSRTGLAAGTQLDLTAQAYTGRWLIGTASVSACADAGWNGEPGSAFLTGEAPLVIALPQQWKECTLEYDVQMLTAPTVTDEQTGEVTYLPSSYTAVDLTAGSLNAVYTADENAHTLAISTGEPLPAAGTYRLTMNWKYKEICFEGTQITFFINYSVTQKQTQQEVPNDE